MDASRDVLAEVTQLLVAHDTWDVGVSFAAGSIQCECGWRGKTVPERAAHQAEALGLAGLLALPSAVTTTVAVGAELMGLLGEIDGDRDACGPTPDDEEYDEGYLAGLTLARAAVARRLGK